MSHSRHEFVHVDGQSLLYGASTFRLRVAVENKVTKGLIYDQQRLDSNDPSGYLSIGFQSLRIFDYSLGGR